VAWTAPRRWRSSNGRWVLSSAASGLAALAGFAVVHAGLAGGISRALGSEGLGLAHGVPLASRLLYTLAIVFVFLTFAGHASLWAAIAADMGASLIVIFNVLGLLEERLRSARE
jgi:hypothetical protein